MKKLLFPVVAIVFSLVLFSCESESVKSDTAKTVKQEVEQQAKLVTNATSEVAKVEGAINWLTVEEAQLAVKKNPKKIFMDVYTPWCGPCKMLDRRTFNQPEVIQLMNEHFYAVKFNAESADPIKFNGKPYENPRFDPNRSARQRNYPHQFSQALGIRGYPSLVVFDADLNKVKAHTGFLDAGGMVQLLNSLK